MGEYSNAQDAALSKLQALINEWEVHLEEAFNETDTRVKFIDPLLCDVLGWDEFKHIRREIRYTHDEERKAIDYVLSLKDPILVVEAKRLFKKFEIPERPANRYYSLSGVMTKWKHAWSAIEQAREYCDKSGARYALVTNGQQFIAFKAISERGVWTEGQAIVFRDPKDLVEGFPLLYECLAAEAISGDRLSAIARQHLVGRYRSKIRAAYPDPGPGFRNKLYDVLQETLGELLLDIAEPTQEFLKECYCTSADVLKYGTQLDAIISDPVPAFRSPISEVRAGHRKDQFDLTMRQLVSKTGGKPLIVVIGGPGVGKTSFLNWYFRLRIKETVKDEVIVNRLDYRNINVELEHVHAMTVRKLVAQFEEEHPELFADFSQQAAVFQSEIAAAFRGMLKPWSADEVEREKRTALLLQEKRDFGDDHLRKTVQYLQHQCKRRVIIVLDNVDQKSTTFQSSLYQTAQQLAFDTGAIVVISLRESTYFRLTRSPQLDAFSPIDFHVRSQPLDLILERRLGFVSNHLTSTPLKLYNAGGVEYDVSDIDRFVAVLRRSFVGEYADKRTLECITAISNSNLRAQLRLVHTFLISGQTKIDDYFWIYASSQSRSIPFHEVLHSLMFADRKIFVERSDSPFMNVYEPGPGAAASHFTVLRTLLYYQSLGQRGDLNPSDFIKFDQVYHQFDSLGLSRDEFAYHFQRLVAFGLLAPTSLDSSAFDAHDRFALTRSGDYFLKNLATEYAYLEAVALDTTIFDEETVDECARILGFDVHGPKLEILTRLGITKRFIMYLARQEQRELALGSAGRHDIFAQYRFSGRMLDGYRRVARGVRNRENN